MVVLEPLHRRVVSAVTETEKENENVTEEQELVFQMDELAGTQASEIDGRKPYN